MLFPPRAEIGISVFAYAPGFVRTGVTEHIANSANVPKEMNERFQQRFETGQGIDSMEDVTKKLMFLVSGQADALTGRHISIHDPEDELIENIDTILSDNLYTLGLIK